MEYKHNHYIPRFILNSWCIEGHNYNGVHVYEILKQKKTFSDCKGKKGYSFALIDNMYIPVINDKRATSVEKWFQSHEYNLSYLINSIDNDKIGNANITDENFIKIIKAIIGLEYRSGYVLDKTRKEILSLNILKDNYDIKKATLENMIDTITEITYGFLPAHVMITHLRNKELLLSDRPVVDGGDFKIAAVGRKLMVQIFKSSYPLIMFKKEDPDFVDVINECIVKNARNWLVAGSKDLLNKYIPFFKTNEYQQEIQNEKCIKHKPIYIELGSSIEN